MGLKRLGPLVGRTYGGREEGGREGGGRREGGRGKWKASHCMIGTCWFSSSDGGLGKWFSQMRCQTTCPSRSLVHACLWSSSMAPIITAGPTMAGCSPTPLRAGPLGRGWWTRGGSVPLTSSKVRTIHTHTHTHTHTHHQCVVF